MMSATSAQPSHVSPGRSPRTPEVCRGANRRNTAGGLLLSLTLSLLVGLTGTQRATASSWDTDSFPNVLLTTRSGETVRFLDDLVRDKVVVINFIYTSCVDTCPLETAHLVRVADLLGDRVGRDVFFYSITIDPDVDTPEVLDEYANRFGADWPFLTGDAEDITLLRRKLGLYIEGIQDGSGNHNVSMIMGNHASGQWRKSSPFENVHVTADKIGRWLTGWTTRSDVGDYATAPALRRISRGEQLFRTRCSGCHVVGDGATDDGSMVNALGPDLAGVTHRREREWLIRWLGAPDEMLAEGDPIALALLERYDGLPMPNLRLNQVDVMALIDYLDEGSPTTDSQSVGAGAAPDSRLGMEREYLDATNARVRAMEVDDRATAGYVTFSNDAASNATIVAFGSEAFEHVEMHEPASLDDGSMMRQIHSLEIPAGDSVEFSPGGRHLMLIGPRRPLHAGQQIDVTVTFSSGRQQVAGFRIVDVVSLR